MPLGKRYGVLLLNYQPMVGREGVAPAFPLVGPFCQLNYRLMVSLP